MSKGPSQQLLGPHGWHRDDAEQRKRVIQKLTRAWNGVRTLFVDGLHPRCGIGPDRRSVVESSATSHHIVEQTFRKGKAVVATPETARSDKENTDGSPERTLKERSTNDSVHPDIER